MKNSKKKKFCKFKKKCLNFFDINKNELKKELINENKIITNYK